MAKADADSARADVLLQQAAVTQAELDVSYTRVIAPQSGRVTHKSVAVGDYLKVGQSILSVVPSQPWVTANFRETQLRACGRASRRPRRRRLGVNLHGRVDSIGRRHRLALQPAAAGERDRQLREGGAAHPGAHRLDRQARTATEPASARACRSSPKVEVR